MGGGNAGAEFVVGYCTVHGCLFCSSSKGLLEARQSYRHPPDPRLSQTRFEQIKRYYHVAALDAPTHTATGRRLWHSKVDPLLDQLRYSSQHYRMPSTHIAIDECMIWATGRSQDTYKMPSKPIQQGFKFHCLADHGYIWDFHPGRP